MHNTQQLKETLKQKGIIPRKRFGQNFLTNARLAEKIAQAVKKSPPPYLEIGPGLGALTRFFHKKDISLIERDKKLAAYWKTQGYTVYCQDALKFNFTQAPQPFVLFGNLPYSLAGPLIIKTSVCKNISNMVFMMQKEVALRAQSAPSKKTYGLLSVISQLFWKTIFIGNASSKDFYPHPKVTGQILKFIRMADNITEPKNFILFLKLCFANRRKQLLKQLLSPHISLYKPKDNLKKISSHFKVRAEELSPKDFLKLYNLTVCGHEQKQANFRSCV